MKREVGLAARSYFDMRQGITEKHGQCGVREAKLNIGANDPEAPPNRPTGEHLRSGVGVERLIEEIVESF